MKIAKRAITILLIAVAIILIKGNNKVDAANYQNATEVMKAGSSAVGGFIDVGQSTINYKEYAYCCQHDRDLNKYATNKYEIIWYIELDGNTRII